MRSFFSWQGLGAALLGVLLAKWAWVLLAPVDSPLPATTAWGKPDDAEHLFGIAATTDQSAAPLGNIRLIGVFAHRTAGFAVLQVEDKQVGVGLGDQVMPGVRLVETNADHVMLERAGIRQRVDLSVVTASGVSAAPVAATPAAPTSTAAAPLAPATNNTPAPAANNLPADQRAALQQQMQMMENANVPPEQRAALQRKLGNLRSRF